MQCNKKNIGQTNVETQENTFVQFGAHFELR
jgi:hypothetical protein